MISARLILIYTIRQNCVVWIIIYIIMLCCSVQDIALYHDEMHGAAVSVTAKKDKNYGQYKVLVSFPMMLNSTILH